MRDMIRMVVVLTVLSAFSGGLLAAIRNGTMARIENQQLQLVKGPVIQEIMQGASNDPVADRFKLADGDQERTFFVGKFDGQPNTVAFETFGKGYGGDVGLMVGINTDTAKIVGVGVTTHSETPGLGARAKTDPAFAAQFKDKMLTAPFAVSGDGGQINALSGATITSRAVCAAATAAEQVYQRLEPQLKQKLQEFAQ